MRVMVIVKATAESEAGVMPGPGRPDLVEMMERMGRFNQELIAAGVMLDGAGLKPTSAGARVRFTGDDRTVVKGPFGGGVEGGGGGGERTEDLIAGYWVWKVGSLEEAIEWARRCPHPHPGTDTALEIRPLYEESDFAI